MKDKIRPIYAELKGYLTQAPSPSSKSSFSIKEVWDRYNNTIQELNGASGRDYSRFSVIPTPNQNYRNGLVSILDYRTKLNGLISRLHAEYFSNESEPFSGSPTTLISQNQSQSQSMHVQILLDMQSIIDKKLGEYEAGSKEYTFLEKVRASLSGVRNITELLNLIFKTGKEIGLAIERVASIFF